MTPKEGAEYLEVQMDKEVEQLCDAAKSRARRSVNIMRNSALKVLTGERHGRVYKLPGTHGKRQNKTTKSLIGEYGHNLQGGQLYRASAPGEPPAVRTGNLRRNWRQYVLAKPRVKHVGMQITCRLKSDMPYSDFLDTGTPNGKIKPRPYKQKIIDQSMPKIDAIYDNL